MPIAVSAALPGDGTYRYRSRLAVLEQLFASSVFHIGCVPTMVRPFASRGAGGLSQLSVKVIKPACLPERIAPGQATARNGRHVRMHLTLLQDTELAKSCFQHRARRERYR